MIMPTKLQHHGSPKARGLARVPGSQSLVDLAIASRKPVAFKHQRSTAKSAQSGTKRYNNFNTGNGRQKEYPVRYEETD